MITNSPGRLAWRPHLEVAKFPKIMALPEVFFCSSKEVSTASIRCVVLTTSSTRYYVSWDEATRKHFHQPLISIVKLMGKPSASADVAANLLCASLTATRNPMFLLWPCHNIVLSAPIEGSSSDTEATCLS